MDESSNTTTTTSINSTKNADTGNSNVDLGKKRGGTLVNNKDATIETLKSSTMHNNSGSSSNLGCGTPSTIPETTILTSTPTNCSSSEEDKIVLPLTSKSNTSSKNVQQHGLDEKCLRNSILTTTMAAASGLPLQQRPQQQPLINLQVSTTTGGNFGVTVDAQISVDTLKKLISKKLKVAKDRICLLHREK